MAESTDPGANDASAAPATPNNSTTATGSATGAPVADLQTQITQALQTQQAEFAKQLKEATGHSDLKTLTEARLEEQGKHQELSESRRLEAEKAKADLAKVKIETSLLAASAEAINPAVVCKLLSIDAVYDNDTVTVGGKSVADAVKALLAENPYLAKAQGGTGSGAPQNAGGGNQITRADFEKLDHPARAKFIQTGGQII